MDDAGNILIRRYSRNNVYVKSTANSSKDETAIGGEIQKLPNQALEIEKISKLFDVKKFQSNITRELKQAYPDRRRLELQCLSAIAFVRTESDILDCPIWVLVINVVAMDMLKSKMPPSKYNLFSSYYFKFMFTQFYDGFDAKFIVHRMHLYLSNGDMIIIFNELALFASLLYT